ASVDIQPRPATITYTGPSGLNASSAAVAARLADAADAGSARLEGHTITIAVGSAECTATTDVTGLARCTINASALPLGPASVSVTSTEDRLYTTVSASAPVVLYALPAGGVFVVGDRAATGNVTFWSPRWSEANGLGSETPPSFKGFATTTVPACGTRWTASPGFDHAPAQAPGWMAVVVTSTSTKNGATIAGETAHVVVVRTDAYNPTDVGRGTVV